MKNVSKASFIFGETRYGRVQNRRYIEDEGLLLLTLYPRHKQWNMHLRKIGKWLSQGKHWDLHRMNTTYPQNIAKVESFSNNRKRPDIYI